MWYLYTNVIYYEKEKGLENIISYYTWRHIIFPALNEEKAFSQVVECRMNNDNPTQQHSHTLFYEIHYNVLYICMYIVFLCIIMWEYRDVAYPQKYWAVERITLLYVSS